MWFHGDTFNVVQQGGKLHNDRVVKTKKKTKNQSESPRVKKKARAFNALMRRLEHVRPSGPYTRDEMNER